MWTPDGITVKLAVTKDLHGVKILTWQMNKWDMFRYSNNELEHVIFMWITDMLKFTEGYAMGNSQVAQQFHTVLGELGWFKVPVTAPAPEVCQWLVHNCDAAFAVDQSHLNGKIRTVWFKHSDEAAFFKLKFANTNNLHMA